MNYSFIKKFIIVVIWIIILNLFITFFYGFFFSNDIQTLKDEIFFRTKYYSREVVETYLKYDDIKDNKNNIISKNNISVKITDIDYKQESGNLRLNLEFYTNDEQDLTNLYFMLRVHDSENIFYNDPIGVEAIYLIDNIDNLIYKQNLYKKIDTRGLNFVKANENVNRNINNSNGEKDKTLELNLDLEDNYEISNELTIKILDLIYQPSGDFSYKAIEPLGEFKFTIKF